MPTSGSWGAAWSTASWPTRMAASRAARVVLGGRSHGLPAQVDRLVQVRVVPGPLVAHAQREAEVGHVHAQAVVTRRGLRDGGTAYLDRALQVRGATGVFGPCPKRVPQVRQVRGA